MLTSNGYRLDQRPGRLGALAPAPDHERRSATALRRRLREEGYAFLPGMLDPDLVTGFRAHYFDQLGPAGLTERSRDGDPLDRGRVRSVLFGEVVPGTAYEQLCRHPDIAGWFGWLLGGEIHLHRRRIIRHVRPGETGVGIATQAHYDLLYLREGSTDVLSLWIPLGDCPLDRGGLTYLEGSHHRVAAEEAALAARGEPLRPAASITADLPGLAEAQNARWLVADYAAGDVVVHTSRIVHAALDNVSDVVRLSTDIRYQRADRPIDARWQSHWRDDDGL